MPKTTMIIIPPRIPDGFQPRSSMAPTTNGAKAVDKTMQVEITLLIEASRWVP